jgi:hypothetical protein
MYSARELEARSEEIASYLREEVQHSPYRALAIALAAGYVLGGGLTPRVVTALLLTGSRMMAGNFLAATVRGLLDPGHNDLRRIDQ